MTNTQIVDFSAPNKDLGAQLIHLSDVIVEAAQHWHTSRNVLENAEQLKKLSKLDEIADSDFRVACMTQLDLVLASAAYQESALRSWSNRVLSGFGRVLEAVIAVPAEETAELKHEGINNEK